jgi:glutamate racemase
LSKRQAEVALTPPEISAEPGTQPMSEAAPDVHRAPVGVFDSGVGGLTILRDLLRELPSERYVYFGDTGNCPYGVRPEREIQRLALAGARFLLERGAKIIVVACNTASVSALKELRAAFDVSCVGVVPAIKPAAERTVSGVIGVAATEASARSDYLKRLEADHAGGVRVLAVGCPRLVALTEAGMLEGPVAEAAIRAYLEPLLAAGIDKLVLGCTHFPAMRSVFERVAGTGVEVIDSGAAVARQTRRVLEGHQSLASPATGPSAAPRPMQADDELWCSGDVMQFNRVATAILGYAVTGRYTPSRRAASVEV